MPRPVLQLRQRHPQDPALPRAASRVDRSRRPQAREASAVVQFRPRQARLAALREHVPVLAVRVPAVPAPLVPVVPAPHVPARPVRHLVHVRITSPVVPVADPSHVARCLALASRAPARVAPAVPAAVAPAVAVVLAAVAPVDVAVALVRNNANPVRSVGRRSKS